jgi:hypothetical protein
MAARITGVSGRLSNSVGEFRSLFIFRVRWEHIREVSHQYENDNDNEHVITLWVRASKSRRHLAPFRSDKFVTFQTNVFLLICFDMWSFYASKCNPIWLFEKELMTCSLSYSYWCEASRLHQTWDRRLGRVLLGTFWTTGDVVQSHSREIHSHWWTLIWRHFLARLAEWLLLGRTCRLEFCRVLFKFDLN